MGVEDEDVGALDLRLVERLRNRDLRPEDLVLPAFQSRHDSLIRHGFPAVDFRQEDAPGIELRAPNQGDHLQEVNQTVRCTSLHLTRNDDQVGGGHARLGQDAERRWTVHYDVTVSIANRDQAAPQQLFPTRTHVERLRDGRQADIRRQDVQVGKVGLTDNRLG